MQITDAAPSAHSVRLAGLAVTALLGSVTLGFAAAAVRIGRWLDERRYSRRYN